MSCRQTQCFKSNFFPFLLIFLQMSSRPARASTSSSSSSSASSASSPQPIEKDKPYECEHCDAKFEHLPSVRRHQRRSCKKSNKSKKKKPSSPQRKKSAADEKPYKCEHCAAKFACLSSVGRHQRRSCKFFKNDNEGRNNFQCTKCKRTFSRKDNMERHFKIHTTEKEFQCDICQKLYNNKSSLVRHQEMHRASYHKCHVCNKQFALSIYLKRHLECHAQLKKYMCEVCGKRFASKPELNAHGRVHRKTNDVSFLKFRIEGELKVNRMYNTDTDSYEFETVQLPPDPAHDYSCPMCDEEHIRDLREHFSINHPSTSSSCESPPHKKPKIICSICGKQFSKQGSLPRHMRTHSKDRPFKCERCGAAYTQKMHLKRHVQSRHERALHGCKICGKTFKSSDYLKKHVANHSNKYRCSICKRKFETFYQMKKHVNKHRKNSLKQRKSSNSSSPIEYVYHHCKVCDKKFTKPWNLRQHMRVHSKNRYICDYCGQKFCFKSNLTVHVNKKHT